LQVWETTNFQASATSNISSSNAITSNLLRWGADGLAFLEDDFPVWIRSSLVRTASGTDTDQDGIPDDWELLHALNPNLPSDALADPDQDGVLNRDEYLQGTDPQLADGPLRVFVRRVTSEGLVVRFAGRSGYFYRIERSTQLSPASWQILAKDLIGQGTMVSFTCPTFDGQGFIRVVEQSSP
jgi:hypothetical protein